MDRSKKGSLLVAALAVGAVSAIVGCSGSGGGRSGTRTGEFVGRVTSVVNWKMPDDIFTRLTPDVRASLQAKGITIDDAKRTMISSELPLMGHWVKIGDRYSMTDKDGKFTVKGTIPNGGNAAVFSQLDGTIPEGEVPLSSIVPTGKTPSSVRLTLDYSLPDDMDKRPPETASKLATRSRQEGGQAPDECDLRNPCLPPLHPDGNKAPCCLDYNGDAGDGLPRQRKSNVIACTAKAVQNFVNSDCYLWTFTKPNRPCVNEGGVNHEGPGCWINHAFRNCQNMDEFDFHAPEKVKVGLGEKINFVLRNNTASNYSQLDWVESSVPGKLDLEPSVPSYNAFLQPRTGGFWLAHFNNDHDSHYEEVTLSYIAPNELPDGKKSGVYHLQVSGGGQSVIIEIQIGDVNEIEVTPASASIKKGDGVKLTAVARDSTGKIVEVPFTWTASGGAASVDGSGNVSGLAEGTSVITVSSPGYTDAKGSATISVTDEDPDPVPSTPGRHSLVSVNSKTPPAVVHEYYDKQLKYNWRMTIFPGFVDLKKDGTFEVERKGGEYNYPTTSKGKGTYQVNGNKIKFSYTSGSGPGEMQITGSGELTLSYVFPADGVHFESDVPVTEKYRLK